MCCFFNSVCLLIADLIYLVLFLCVLFSMPPKLSIPPQPYPCKACGNTVVDFGGLGDIDGRDNVCDNCHNKYLATFGLPPNKLYPERVANYKPPKESIVETKTGIKVITNLIVRFSSTHFLFFFLVFLFGFALVL